MCMCICACVMCMCMCLCMCVCACVCVWWSVSVCMCICASVHVCLSMCLWILTKRQAHFLWWKHAFSTFIGSTVRRWIPENPRNCMLTTAATSYTCYWSSTLSCECIAVRTVSFHRATSQQICSWQWHWQWQALWQWRRCFSFNSASAFGQFISGKCSCCAGRSPRCLVPHE